MSPAHESSARDPCAPQRRVRRISLAVLGLCFVFVLPPLLAIEVLWKVLFHTVPHGAGLLICATVGMAFGTFLPKFAGASRVAALDILRFAALAAVVFAGVLFAFRGLRW